MKFHRSSDEACPSTPRVSYLECHLVSLNRSECNQVIASKPYSYIKQYVLGNRSKKEHEVVQGRLLFEKALCQTFLPSVRTCFS